MLILGYEWDDLLNLHCWESDIRGFGIHARKRTIKSIKLGDVGQGWNVSPPMIQGQHMQPTSSDPKPKLRNPSIRTPVYVIRSADDLSVLRRGPGRSRLYVVLEIHGVPPKQALRWESRLNDHLRECGCATGARSILAATERRREAASRHDQAFVQRANGAKAPPGGRELRSPTGDSSS